MFSNLKILHRRPLFLVIAFMLFVATSQAAVVPIVVYENSAGAFTGEVVITDIGGGQVTTRIANTSASGSDSPVIAQVYFETGASTFLSNPVLTNGVDGVNFSAGANPPNPPGGGNIGWGGNAFKFSADNPANGANANGIEGMESLLITWTFQGDFNDFVAAVAGGDSRVAAHILDCDGGNSCTGATTVVPLPGAVWLLGSGLLGLVGLSRRNRRSITTD